MLVDAHIAHSVALAFQPMAHVQHGVVLDGGGDQVAAPLRLRPCHADDGLVVALGAATGKVDLLGVGPQGTRHRATRIIQGLFGALPRLVQAGGIARLVGPSRGSIASTTSARTGVVAEWSK